MTVSDGATAWNAVSANGVQVWQGTLNAANTSQTVEIPENTTTITLNLGNSKATSIKINGKKFDFLKRKRDFDRTYDHPKCCPNNSTIKVVWQKTVDAKV